MFPSVGWHPSRKRILTSEPARFNASARLVYAVPMPALRDGPSISQVAIQILGKREPRAPSTFGNDGNSEASDYLLLRDLAPINVGRCLKPRAKLERQNTNFAVEFQAI